MGWKTTPPTTDDVHEMRFDRSVFYVTDTGGHRYCNFMVSAGKHGEESLEHFLATWPREGLRLLRAELDRIETLLNQQEKERETTV